jgi:hypothetical protein
MTALGAAEVGRRNRFRRFGPARVAPAAWPTLDDYRDAVECFSPHTTDGVGRLGAQYFGLGAEQPRPLVSRLLPSEPRPRRTPVLRREGERLVEVRFAEFREHAVELIRALVANGQGDLAYFGVVSFVQHARQQGWIEDARTAAADARRELLREYVEAPPPGETWDTFFFWRWFGVRYP